MRRIHSFFQQLHLLSDNPIKKIIAMTSFQKENTPLYAAEMFEHNSESSLPCHILMNRLRLSSPPVRTTEPEFASLFPTPWNSSSTPKQKQASVFTKMAPVKKNRRSKHRRNRHQVVFSKEQGLALITGCDENNA